MKKRLLAAFLVGILAGLYACDTAKSLPVFDNANDTLGTVYGKSSTGILSSGIVSSGASSSAISSTMASSTAVSSAVVSNPALSSSSSEDISGRSSSVPVISSPASSSSHAVSSVAISSSSSSQAVSSVAVSSSQAVSSVAVSSSVVVSSSSSATAWVYAPLAANTIVWQPNMGIYTLDSGVLWTVSDIHEGGNSIITDISTESLASQRIQTCGGDNICIDYTIGSLAPTPYAFFGIQLAQASFTTVDISSFGSVCVAYSSTVPTYLQLESHPDNTNYDLFEASVSFSPSCTVKTIPLNSTAFTQAGWGTASTFSPETAYELKFHLTGTVNVQKTFRLYSIGFGNSCTCP